MKLGDLSSVHSGVTPRGGLDVSARGVLAIQLRDVTPEGAINFASVSRVEAEGISERHLVGPGDVLFRSRGVHTYASALNDQLNEPAIAIMPLFIIRPDNDVIDAEYLAWFLNQPAAQRHFAQGATGTKLRMISKPVLEEVQIDLPPLRVQRSIAALSILAAKEQALRTLEADRKCELMALRLAELAHNFTQDRMTL